MGRGKRYTAEQIIKILREVDIYSGQGKIIEQAVRSCGISEQTYSRWALLYSAAIPTIVEKATSLITA